MAATFPGLKIGEWLDDAGVGYGECLEAVWRLGAWRMIDIRAVPADRDPAAWRSRGYDADGRPLCAHGYPLRTNGYGAQRRRTKYPPEADAQVCRRQPRHEGEPVQPVRDCPYLDPERPLGVCVNVGLTLPDGSLRLAREVPHGSATWQARSGRRNLSESRTSQVEGLGLKRLPVCGLARATMEVHLADFLLNLHTLGRLVRGATRPPEAGLSDLRPSATLRSRARPLDGSPSRPSLAQLASGHGPLLLPRNGRAHPTLTPRLALAIPLCPLRRTLPSCSSPLAPLSPGIRCASPATRGLDDGYGRVYHRGHASCGANVSQSIAASARWWNDEDWLHFQKHGRKLGISSLADCDASARATIRLGKEFTYIDPTFDVPHFGYYVLGGNKLTAVNQSKTRIVSH